ncbi:ABC transporter permease [Cytobacillus gottheilii]|uniref:ABC transporter permease n=1 Tax=Cytobacillus gottheilii TaxID=859144 RepID=A0ABX8FB62_9BACI|nr:ABC transporter permease [Cytobacillus gottheilii]QVY61088.1 ABC transporter permease [Cytobacillus gottheilii]
MKHLVAVEWKRALTFNRVLLCLAIILIPAAVQFLNVKTGYMFYRAVDVHTEVIGGVVALLFPLFFIILYAGSYASEVKDQFITYIKPRIKLADYLLAKGIVNGVLSFIVAFAMVFISFVFIVYVEPSLGMIVYENGSDGSVGTFEIFLEYGTLSYGLIYSFWVGINAALYSSAAYVLTLLMKNHFVAISLPFLWYFVMNFVTAILAHPEFSPVSTVFPFNIIQQPLWTIFVPFTIHLMILSILIYYVRNHFQEKVYEYVH